MTKKTYEIEILPTYSGDGTLVTLIIKSKNDYVLTDTMLADALADYIHYLDTKPEADFQ